MRPCKLLTILSIILSAACGEKPIRSTTPVARRPRPRVTRTEASATGPVRLDGIPRLPDRIRDRLQRYLSGRQTSFLDWEDHRGGMLIRTRFGNTDQVFRVGQPGGARRQLTFFEDPVGAARVEPGGYDGSLLLLKDQEGSEANQLYRVTLLEGSVARLTSGGDARTTRFCVARDATVAFNSTARNGRDFDIYLVKPGAGQAELVYEAPGLFVPLDFSPDGRQLLLKEVLSRNHSRLHRLDVNTRRAQRFAPARATGKQAESDPGARATPERMEPEAEIAYRDALWARDGSGIIFSSDHGGEFVQLYYFDLRRQRLYPLTEDIPYDVERITLSQNGRTLAFSVNENGYSALYFLDVRRRRHVRVEMEQGIISGMRFSRDRRRAFMLGFTLSKPIGPAEAYAYNTRTRRLVRWTESEVGGINADFFVEPRLVSYPTFDEVKGEPRVIPAFYYKPPGPGPHPVLVHIHGGPEAQYRPSFDPFLQYLLMDMGVAVVAPNVRGSAGYGKSYLRLDDGKKRMDAVKDIGALLEWIGAQKELDASRVVLSGASYGGFMVLASMARYGKRVRGGIDWVGISNFRSFLENTKPYRRALRRAEYGDERTPEMKAFFRRISPLFQAGKIEAPLFVVQGANDPRVPRSESEQLVRALRGKQRKVWYLLARDEGHRFRRKKTRDLAHILTAYFLETLGLGKAQAEEGRD